MGVLRTFVNLFFVPLDADFSTDKTTVTIPANTQLFEVPAFFTVMDDNIDEDEQSFAIIAEIDQPVPDAVTCFQTAVGETDCFGRRGATEIRITDNDREHSILYILHEYNSCFHLHING